MAGLRPDPMRIILSLLLVLYSVLVTQSLGSAFGAVLIDVKQTDNISLSQHWCCSSREVNASCRLKYLGYSYYCYRLLLGVQYNEDGHHECSHGGNLVQTKRKS